MPPNDEGAEASLLVADVDEHDSRVSLHENRVDTWDDIRSRVSEDTRSKHSEQLDDFLPTRSRAWSEHSHPMGRFEKEGQFLIPCECYQRMPRWKKCACVSGIFFLVAFLVMIPVTFAVIVPNMINDAVSHSTTVLVRAEVSHPDAVASTVRMATTLQLNNAGGTAAKIKSFKVQLYSDERYPFGELTMPDIDVHSNAPTEIRINDTLKVTNDSAFVAATAQVLLGPCDPEIASECAWTAVGKPTVKLTLMGIPLTYTTDFKGSIPMPLTQLANVQANNVQLTGGEKNKVFAVANTSFFSQSLLELTNLGKMVFAVRDLDGEYLGNASMPNFSVLRGHNELDNCHTVMERTPTNSQQLRKFLSGVSQGVDQQVILHGPIDGCALFLQNIVTQNFTIKGVSDLRAAPIRQSLIAKGQAEGFKPGGGTCSLVAGSECVRGSVNVLLSPMDRVDIRFTNLSLNAYLHEEIGYNFTSLLAPGGSVKCPSTSQFVHQFTQKGMYVNDTQRDDILMKPGKPISVVTPAEPIYPDMQPSTCEKFGVFGSPFSCCFTSRQLAASCRAKARGEYSFDTFVNGTVVLGVGDFEIEVDVKQPLISVYFEDAFTTNFEHGLISCSNIELDKP
eukprot:TRINITY_DN7286_c0_g1_i1.p1 TRINITY_DN7286_c0_g1~~TRINITY_DN7286_c0_g1_i1.p1  ORF type:complete len:620 (-),score=111.97 TRINITY_DN7286_c0_g1_i1:63-1922(-)